MTDFSLSAEMRKSMEMSSFQAKLRNKYDKR